MASVDARSLSVYLLTVIPLFLGTCMFGLSLSQTLDREFFHRNIWQVAEIILPSTHHLHQAQCILLTFVTIFFLVSFSITCQSCFIVWRAHSEEEGGDDEEQKPLGCGEHWRAFWAMYTVLGGLIFLGCLASGILAVKFRKNYVEDAVTLDNELRSIYNGSLPNILPQMRNMSVDLLIEEVHDTFHCCGVGDIGGGKYNNLCCNSDQSEIPGDEYSHSSNCGDNDDNNCVASMKDWLKSKTVYISTISFVTCSLSVVYVLAANLVFACFYYLQLPDIDE